MLRLKSCPKCKNGDITLDRDHYGSYECCIQCGFVNDLIDVVESGQQKAHGVKEGRKQVKSLSRGR